MPPETKKNNLATELWLFLELAVPTTLLNLGFIVSPLLTASYVGRKFGPTFLGGFTLANLTGNLCTFSLLAGLFSAADTLGPRAYAASRNHQQHPQHRLEEVGLIAIRGFVLACIILVPINLVLVMYLKDMLVALGQDQVAASHALDWYRIFVWSLPFCVAYNTIWKFLSSQHIMKPMIIVSMISCAIVLPCGLELWTEQYGFLGSAVAYVNFQAFQAVSLIMYLYWKKPHVKGTWPSIECVRQEVLQYQPMMDYISLGMGGIFAQSEWVFWEAVGLVIGLLGVVPLSVHTIPNQVTMLLWLSPLSAGTALSIRLGMTLTISVSHAKDIVLASVMMVTAFFGFVNTMVYNHSDWIIGFFSNDSEVVELAQQIWWKVCVFNQTCALFGGLCGVATGLGMQWKLARINIFWLWIFGLPTIYYFAVASGGGLDAAWTWINVPYVGMNACLLVTFATTDWKNFAKMTQDDKDTNFANSNTMDGIIVVEGEQVGLLSDQCAFQDIHYGSAV
eukprot:scaffold5194_cov118-Cylindrotheca_fusiformis.AAC.3